MINKLKEKYSEWRRKSNEWYEKRGVCFAAERGDTAKVLAILDKGGDVDERYNNSTPVQVAASKGYVETVRVLLERGANVNPSLRYDGDAFKEAVMGGSLEIVQLFLDHGANVNAMDPEHGITALMDAVDTGEVEMVRLLLDRGADVNAEDWEARTALTYARGKGREITELLRGRDGIEVGEWAGNESPPL